MVSDRIIARSLLVGLAMRPVQDIPAFALDRDSAYWRLLCFIAMART